MRQAVADFMHKHGMAAGDMDIGAALDAFVAEMDKGLAGEGGSLLMIPTYMKTDRQLPVDEPIIVMDAGGTNFRVAVVTFHKDGSADIAQFQKFPMPGSKEELGKEQFLNAIVDYMEPVLHASDMVGFCFSFPTEILPDKDGRLLHFNKEIRVRDSEGMVVGHELNQALAARGLPAKQFVLLNDTVAAMFGGMGGAPGKQYDGLTGLILGTGTNTCYIERCEAITKLGGGEGSMAINMESGAYGLFSRSDFDKQLDAATIDPGRQPYEKMISGAYQGQLVTLALLGAAAEGLLSEGFASSLKSAGSLPSYEVDRFMERPFGDGVLALACTSDADREAVFYVIDAVLERAARMMLVNIGAILLKTGAGKNPARPHCVVAEGTAFQKSPAFRAKLNSYVKTELEDARGLYVEFVSLENATLLGTAAAGLMNCR